MTIVVEWCPHPARHQHGTRVAYVADKCRCPQCREANRIDQARARRQRAYGNPAYVDATAARDHVHDLQTRGMGWKRIAAAADVSLSTVHKLLYGAPSRDMGPSKRIHQQTAQALLAVRLDHAPSARVDATGTRRRLQALVWMGWSVRHLTSRLGCDRQKIDALLAGNSRTTAATAEAVADLYDRIWNQTPPQASSPDTE